MIGDPAPHAHADGGDLLLRAARADHPDADAAGPPLAWKASGLGGGFSSLAIAGDRIYTLGDLPGGQHALALGRKDGKVLWKSRVGPVWDDEYGGPRGTPSVAGGAVYALGTEGDLVAVDAASGKELWRRDTGQPLGAGVVTYSAGGRQLVTVGGGAVSGSWPVKGGSSRIVVFGLKKRGGPAGRRPLYI